MALKGIAISCAANSSEIASGTGNSPPAGAMKYSDHEPWTLAVATLWPT